MTQVKTESPYWRRLERNVFEHRGKQSAAGEDGMHDCTVPELGIIRNASVKFDIEVKSGPTNFHAAVLFRKNGKDYLGAGLGGWNSYYSVFSRGNTRGFTRIAIGGESQIQEGRTYKCEIEFHSGILHVFKKDGESLLPMFSFRDSLASDLRLGHIGVYAYNLTWARLYLDILKKPNRCFVITNINGALGRETTKRRRIFERLLPPKSFNLEFCDSRDLTREHPLMPKIRQAIIESDIVIVDLGRALGEPRPNVYYELGIAHSVGVPTIHIGPSQTKFSNKQIVPSDLRSQYFILDEEINSKLSATVKGILDAHAGGFNYLG
jgi:hypothetical protein